MKIIVYKDNFATGRGADRSVLNFVNVARNSGAEVIVLTNQAKETPFSAPVDSAIRRVFVPYRPFAGVVDAVDGLGADLVVVAGSNEVIALTAEKVVKTPILLQLHLCPTGFLKRFHPFRNRAFLRALAYPAVVQVLCKSYEPLIRRYVRGRLVTIGNFTEIEVPATTIPEQPIILYPAAQINKVKNQLLLIRAFAQIMRDVPCWTLRLCGLTNTKYAEKCRRFVQKHHLDKQVVFVGYQKDMATEYAKCAFVAHTSRLEGFPLAFLEAAKFGKATLALKSTPGNDEIIKNQETGLLSDDSPAAFGEALARLMGDAGFRRTLGKNAREIANRCSRETISEQWVKVLNSIMP